MLSLMQKPQPLPMDSCPPSTCISSNSMSVAILPSAPANYSQAPLPALLLPNSSTSKRPRLTLNTTDSTLPTTIGKGSTSLRLETLSATSPTVRNTFTNGYNAAQRIVPGVTKFQKPALTPLTTDVPLVTPKRQTPVRAELPSSTDSVELTSASTISTTSTWTDSDPLPTEAPYKLAEHIASILSNGPFSSSKRSKLSRTREMSQTSKKVAFRAPLTEEIQTTKYTMAHSDISSSTISTLELPPPAYTKDEGLAHKEAQSGKAERNAEERAVKTAAQTGAKRESDEEDSDTCPSTPVAGRRKRHRQWRWTLGPITSGESTSHDERHDEVLDGEVERKQT